MNRGPSLIALLSLSVASTLIGSCGSQASGTDVTCGTGTILDDTTHQCIPDETDTGGGFGAVIATASLGDLTLSQVTFPDSLATGDTGTISFNVTNNTTAASQLTLIQIAATKADKASVDTYLANVATKGQSCTNTCASHNDNVCDDGEVTSPQVTLTRSFQPNVGHWVSVSPAPAGFTPDQSWVVYATQQRGTHQVFECGLGGANFLSKASNCEGQTVLGSSWFLNAAKTGAVELFRCIDNGDHFVAADSTCAGKTLEGSLGFVMTAPAAGKCAKGSDCHDCGLRGGLTACVPVNDASGKPTSAQSTCPQGFYCHPAAKACHLELLPIKGIDIDTIPAGGTVPVSSSLQLPPNWRMLADGTVDPIENYNLVFSAREVLITKDSKGNFINDPSQPSLAEGQVPIERAAAVFNAGAFATTMGAKRLVVTSSSLASSAFVLDNSQIAGAPILTATVRLQARGGPVAGPVDVGASLLLPGHSLPLRAGYDPATSVQGYDPNRLLPVVLYDPVLKRRTSSRARLLQRSCDKTQSACSPTDHSIEDLQEVTVTLNVFLEQSVAKGLSETLNQRAANPGLTAKNELPGKLRLEFGSSEGQRSTLDLDVMFLPPAASVVATSNDPSDPGAISSAIPGADLTAADVKYQPYGNMYPEQDNLTPLLYNSFGTSWAGASYQLKNVSSKERFNQAVIKQQLLADDYAKLSLLTYDLYLLKVAANVDIGTQRALSTDVATLEVKRPPTNVMDLAGDLVGMNTLLSVSYDYSKNCSADPTEPTLEKCPLLGGDDGSDPEWGTVSFNMPEAKESFELTAKKEKTVCYEILCATVGVSVSLEVGVEGSLALFQDKAGPPERFTGVEATFGPFAEATGTAYGEVGIVVAGAEVEGNVKFIDAHFTPTARLGIDQQLRTEGASNCWWKNNGRITFEGPASLEMLSGNIKVSVWAGVDIDLGFYTIHLRKTLFEDTLVEWDPVVSEQWTLWSVNKVFAGGAGLCADAPRPNRDWKSPIGCKTFTGSDGYCANSLTPQQRILTAHVSDGVAPYQGKYWTRFYTGPSQCGNLVVNGSVEFHGSSWNLENSESVGDALVFSVGPHGRPGDVQAADASICRWMRKGIATGGTVACGRWVDAQIPNEGVFSGEFKDARFAFCNTKGYDQLRWVDVYLITDGTVSRDGVSIRLETQEGEEAAFASDEGWWVSAETPSLTTDPNFSNSWKRVDYNSNEAFVRPTVVASSLSAGAYASGSGAVAPFNAADGQNAKWIWLSTASDGQKAYFRRPFVASKDSYSMQLACDDTCTAFLDGEQVGTNSAWNSPSIVTLNTHEGQMHMLAILATNGSYGAAINVMVK